VYKTKMGKILLTTLAALSLITISLGGFFANGVSAAAPGNQVVRFYGSNLPTDQIGVDKVVTMVVSLLDGNDSSKLWNSRQQRVSPAFDAPLPEVWYNQNQQNLQSLPMVSAPVDQLVPAAAPGPVAGGFSVEKQQALKLLNADRSVHGLPPLKISAQLSNLADNYAQDLINRHFFSHNNPEGQSPFDRMRQQSIPFGYAGENLAINTGIPSAEQAFMNSPGHRANILNSHYTQVGIGVGFGSQGTVYVVQEFTDG